VALNTITLTHFLCGSIRIYLPLISENKDVQTSEELSLITVATINNLSFYNTKTSAITAQQMRIINSKYHVLGQI
jgi:hypothetical protein